MDTANAPNWYPDFYWYLLDALSSATSHNIARTLDGFIICRIWQLPAEWIVSGTHTVITENVYATRKPAFPSFPPYQMLLRAYVMSPEEICEAKRTQQSIRTNKQQWQQCLWQNSPWSDVMNATSYWHWDIQCSIIRLKKLSDSGNILRLLRAWQPCTDLISVGLPKVSQSAPRPFHIHRQYISVICPLL
jgi:hypothetical protein